jgi:hypothetical protein
MRCLFRDALFREYERSLSTGAELFDPAGSWGKSAEQTNVQLMEDPILTRQCARREDKFIFEPGSEFCRAAGLYLDRKLKALSTSSMSRRSRAERNLLPT